MCEFTYPGLLRDLNLLQFCTVLWICRLQQMPACVWIHISGFWSDRFREFALCEFEGSKKCEILQAGVNSHIRVVFRWGFANLQRCEFANCKFLFLWIHEFTHPPPYPNLLHKLKLQVCEFTYPGRSMIGSCAHFCTSTVQSTNTTVPLVQPTQQQKLSLFSHLLNTSSWGWVTIFFWMNRKDK